MNPGQGGYDQRLNQKKFIEDYQLAKDQSDEDFLRGLRDKFGLSGARASSGSQERNDYKRDKGDQMQQKIR